MRNHLIISLIFLLLFSSCTSPKGEIRRDKVRVVTLKGPSSIGMLHFAERVKAAGDTTIEFIIVDEPMLARKMMIEGSADFCALPTTMASLLYNKGLDYRIVAVPVWGTIYIAGDASAGVEKWSDLKGKRVNVMAKGMTPDLLLRYLLIKNGLNPDNDLILDYSFPKHIELANAVAASIAKIGVITEPYLSLVMGINPNVVPLFDLSEEWNKVEGSKLAETAFVARGELIDNQLDIVERVVNGYRASTQWVLSNKDSAAVLMVESQILNDSVAARRAIDYSALNVVESKDIKNEIEAYLKVFFELSPQSVGGKMVDEKFYY